MINSQELLDVEMGIEIVDKVKNEADDFVYLVKWAAPTLSYLALEKIKQNLQPKDILIYRNGDPLHDSEKDHFIGLVFENKGKIESTYLPGNSDSVKTTNKRFEQ